MAGWRDGTTDSSAHTAPGRVLLVDDSRLVRVAVGNLLRAAGHVVDEANDGVAALEQIRTHSYDVILSDLTMPEMDGFGLLETVKRSGPDEAEVIILTGTHARDPEAAIRALRLGADDFLVKADKPDQLLAAVARALQRKRERAALKTAEEALARSERRLRTIIDAGPQGLQLLDAAGRILEMNAAGLRMIEAEAISEVPGQSYAALLAEQDRPAFLDLLARATQGYPAILEFRVTGLHGTPRRLETNAVPLRDDKDQLVGVIQFLRDVTGQREAEDALRLTEAQLRQAQKMEAVGRLAGGIAHDFNNLLSVIVGYCDLLGRDKGLLPGQARRIEHIRKATQSAATLTRQLLAFSRKQVLQPEVISLATVIREVDPMLRRLIGEDIQLVTVVADDTWPVYADPAQLEEVILNLAVNARDAMPLGGRLTIEASNVVLDAAFAQKHPGARPGRYAALSVSDTGTGMDTATLAQVFEPFFTTKEAGKGTGLGLAMVYGIVKQSEGYIEVDSLQGRGTTFRIHLRRTTRKPATPGPEVAVAEVAHAGQETVLVVDDQDDVRRVVREMIESGGYSVLEAKTPEGALAVAERDPGAFQCVLTDVVMAHMDGYQLGAALLARIPNVRIIHMSGHSDQATRRSVSSVGPRGALLPKPVSRDRLLAAIREALDAPGCASGDPGRG